MHGNLVCFVAIWSGAKASEGPVGSSIIDPQSTQWLLTDINNWPTCQPQGRARKKSRVTKILTFIVWETCKQNLVPDGGLADWPKATLVKYTVKRFIYTQRENFTSNFTILFYTTTVPHNTTESVKAASATNKTNTNYKQIKQTHKPYLCLVPNYISVC